MEEPTTPLSIVGWHPLGITTTLLPHSFARLQIRQYKASLEGVTGDLKRAKEKFQRSSLLGSPAGGAGGRLDFDKSLCVSLRPCRRGYEEH